MLAGVSITWYTWLEQGRRINASPDVLSAIGRALRLDDAGIEHLRALAQPSPSPVAGPQEAPSALVRLIESMEPAPAYVLAQAYRRSGRLDRAQELLARVSKLNAQERGDDPDGNRDLKRMVVRLVRESTTARPAARGHCCRLRRSFGRS